MKPVRSGNKWEEEKPLKIKEVVVKVIELSDKWWTKWLTDAIKYLIAQDRQQTLKRLDKAIKQIEALKYNEPLDSEMRIVNMIANSSIAAITKAMEEVEKL